MPVKDVLASTAFGAGKRAQTTLRLQLNRLAASVHPSAVPAYARLQAFLAAPSRALPPGLETSQNQGSRALAFFCQILQNLFKLIQFISGIVGKGRCIDFSTVHF